MFFLLKAAAVLFDKQLSNDKVDCTQLFHSISITCIDKEYT